MTEAVRPDGGAITRGFLFADLRGYTAFVEAHGDSAASALLDAYRRLVRDVVARHDGAEIKTEGDSFYVVFPSASGAVLCGLDIAAAAAAHTLADPEHPIRVGIGVHAGESVAAAEGYVGSAVNIAARVCAQAKAGQVVVTETVRSLTRTSGRLQFVPLGKKHLKGIAEAIAIYRAEPADSAVAAAAGGRGRFWRRPWALAAVGGLLAIGAIAALALNGGLAPRGPTASDDASGVHSVERIVYSEAEPSALDFSVTNARQCRPGRNLYEYVGDVRLALADPEGGDPQYLTQSGNELEVYPTWSPDGQLLAFIGWSSSGGASSVNVLDVVSGKATKLASFTPDESTGPAARIEGVSWSPDGTQLLFGWGEHLWVVSADKSDPRMLSIGLPTSPTPTPDPVYGDLLPQPVPVSPVWLSDGSIMALLDDQMALRTNGGRRGERILAFVAGESGNLAPVPWLGGMRVESAAWSPDQTRVAFVGADTAGLSPTDKRIPDLFVANVDGSGLHRIDSAHGIAADPPWSPDGTKLVFGFGPLHVVDADGGVVRDVTNVPDRAACWPMWGRTTSAALTQPGASSAPGATQGPLAFHRGALEAGTYVTGTFQPTMQFTIGPDWEGVSLAADTLRMAPTDIPGAELDILNAKIVIDGPCDDSPTHALSGDPLELVTYLQEHDYLSVGEAVPYPVAGISGLAVVVSESRPLAETDCPGQVEARFANLIKTIGVDWYRIGEGNQVWFIAVQAHGELVAFSIEAPADQLARFQAKATVVLESLTFP